MNNYSNTEKSLKRFLKRKSKITLGFVIAFMIMGTGVFAQGEAISQTEGEKTYQDVYITGLGKQPDGNRQNGISLVGETKGTFNGETLIVDIENKDITNSEVAGVVIRNGATGIFNAKNTVIDVSNTGKSGQWGFGLLVNSNNSMGGKAEFNGENVTINNYQKNYTSQTLTAKTNSSIDFNNSGEVNISSKSEYGVTGVDNQGGKITFNNNGNVNIVGEILPGDKTGGTNVIGIQSGEAGSITEITDKVNNFNITLKGAGVDNDGTSYSTGTKAITMEDGAVATIASQTFNIKMDIDSDIQDDSPEGHTADQAYGLHTNNGNINIKENTTTNIDISQGLGSGYAVYSGGKNSKIEMLGNTNINVNGSKGAFGVSAKDSGTVNLTGKNISISTASKFGNAIAVEVNDDDGTGIGGEIVNLGGKSTENIVLKADGKNCATGIEVVNHGKETKETGSKVEVNSKNLIIDVHSKEKEAAGIWVQNSTMTEASDDKIANVTINSENTIINVTSDTKGNAFGLVTMSQGKLDINGNLEVNAGTAILTRGNAVTNINKNNDKTIKLNGDIEFNYDAPSSGTPVDATINLNLSNEESFLKGKIVVTGEDIPENYEKVSEMNLGLSNKAIWENTGDSFVSNLTLDNGIINNNSVENDISVGTLLGNGGTLNMAAAINEKGEAISGKLEIGKVENDSVNFIVNYAGDDNLELNNSAEAEKVFGELAENIKVENGKFNADAKLSEGFVSSEYTSEFTKDENGNIVVKEDSVKMGNLNSMVQGMRDLATINLLTWRQEMNSLNKRMGELRNSTGEHGVWSRVYAGKIENGSQYDNEYQSYQVGYDKKYSVDNGTVFVGALVSYTDGETNYKLGSGENYSVGAGVYATWLNNDGQFADVILKQSRLHNKFDVTSKDGDKSQHGDYNNWGTSLSGQYGKRFDLNEKFFVEPSAELTLGRVDAVDYTTSADVKVHQDSMYSLVGNIGTAVGYKFSDKGNVYARASLVKEFQGDIDTEYRKDGAVEKTNEDLSDTWAEFGIGVNYRFVENFNIYADIQKTGDATVDTEWQGNLGFRYEF